ncbi:ScbR family autoregulator-binding transcription factor [Streptomyces alanosinicus]|uniref:Gamma-butyrolactone-binding protein n=1 Tax=Streptomyces alanosinicus TaxID=68171 RepID=A0A919D883_9ACTN|nr:ScbR family autoregulator-binding transcription factor [Streptomyces alanosinicus]GHE12700.1 gamma-butyrolactone-binding protein [Streptomyces alanosinicus]
MARSKQQRSVETREAILRAAAAVFEESGYAGASISRILQRAGATAGSLYFHFKSKEELARAVMTAQPETIVPHLASEGLQRLVDITLVWCHQLRLDLTLRAGVRLTTEQTTFGMADAAAPYDEWVAIMADVLETAAERGELQPGIDPKGLATFIVEHCTGMQLYSAARSSDRADLPQRVVSMWQLLLPGIAVPTVAVRIETRPDRFHPTAA